MDQNKSGIYRNIYFTVNNYSDQEHDDLLKCKYFKYVIIGKEVGKKVHPTYKDMAN
jgi:hypothetical protein